MKVSLTYTPKEIEFGPIILRNQPPADAFALAAELGFDGVEIHIRRPDDLDWREVKTLCGTHGLSVTTIGTGMAGVMDGLTFGHENAETRQRAVALVIQHIENAAELGSAVTIGFLNGKIGASGERRETLRRALVDCYAQAAAVAEKHGVTLLCEPLNRYECDYPNSVQQGLELIAEAGSPAIKLLCDTYHMNIEERDICQSFRLAGDRLGYVHFADSNRYGPGAGHIPFDAVAAALKEIGYTGVIGLEHLMDQAPRPTAEQSVRIIRSLIG